MPTSRTDTRVQCPFYLYDEPKQRRITCEGLMDGCTLVLRYKQRRDFRIQLDAFCCARYEHCEIYRMLMQKYEEDNV